MKLMFVGCALHGARCVGGDLKKGELDIIRCKDANAIEPARAVVRALEFHPQGEILLAAGLDKTVVRCLLLVCMVVLIGWYWAGSFLPNRRQKKCESRKSFS
jgi:hypothetical protein